MTMIKKLWAKYRLMMMEQAIAYVLEKTDEQAFDQSVHLFSSILLARWIVSNEMNMVKMPGLESLKP